MHISQAPEPIQRNPRFRRSDIRKYCSYDCPSCIDNNKHKYQLSLDDNSIEKDIPDINLENYDSIFKENKEISPEFDYNMYQVFSNNNLESILLEIEKLKSNKDDQNKIEDIYYQIKLRQNDLSLNDYNYLINRLLEIKK